MRTLVTGGAGFIGSTLVDRLLAEGHAVDVVDDLSSGSLVNLADARANPDHDFTFHRLDVRSSALTDLIIRRQPEVVFHLAAQADVRVSVERPGFDAEVNIIGTLNVLEGARQGPTRKVVFAASGGTLYGEPEELPVRESHPQRPLSPYGVSKKAACDYLAAYRELHGIEYTALALANVYGPRQDPHGEAGVVAIFAGRLLGNEPCTVFGDGEQTRDFVYVGDVVRANLLAVDSEVTEPLNIATGVETPVAAVVAELTATAGAAIASEFTDGPAGEVRRCCLDNSRALRALGWSPSTPLREGLSLTYRAFAAAAAGSPLS